MLSDWWQRTKTCFKEKWLSARGLWTVYFARFQVFLGILIGVLVATDLSPLIRDPKWLAVWLIVAGILTEYLRKRRRENGE